MSTATSLPPRLQQALDLTRALRSRLSRVAQEQGIQEAPLQHLLARLERLIDQLAAADDDYEQSGREVLAALNTQYPGLWATVDRELLWYFGGECLHYLSDEEIADFQAREDAQTN